jgi:hypothetical protein
MTQPVQSPFSRHDSFPNMAAFTNEIESEQKNNILAQEHSPSPIMELFYPKNSVDTYNPPKKDKLPDIPKGPVFSLHVGRVATGKKHTDRAPAHIALVNEWGHIERNLYVKPDKPIVSYLTPISSVDEKIIEKYGLEQENAFNLIKEALGPDIILVGHCPRPDIDAIGLKKGKHYQKIFDLNILWQVWNPTFQIYTRFAIEHLTKAVLNVPYEPNSVSQALNCIRLWNYYLWCRTPSHHWRLSMLRRHIIESPRVENYSARVKTFEGVCLGAKRACVCSCASEKRKP